MTDGIPVVGEPVAYGIGFLVLLLVAWPVTAPWVTSLVTVAHEGGHMVVGLLTGHRLRDFELEESGNAGTHWDAKADGTVDRWGPGRILRVFAGYSTPPVAGLAGSALVLSGRSWSLLWASLILLLGAWSQFRGLLTGLVLLLAGAGIGYVAVQGPAAAQVALAVGLVWLMLLGGLRGAATMSREPGTDPAKLARDTLVPAIVWQGVFLFIAVVCLWLGGRRMLGL